MEERHKNENSITTTKVKWFYLRFSRWRSLLMFWLTCSVDELEIVDTAVVVRMNFGPCRTIFIYKPATIVPTHRVLTVGRAFFQIIVL